LSWLRVADFETAPLALAGDDLPAAYDLVIVRHQLHRVGDPLALLRGTVGLGEWLIFGCVLSWAAYTFIGRQATKSLSPLATTLWGSLTGALLLGVAALIQGGIEPAQPAGIGPQVQPLQGLCGTQALTQQIADPVQLCGVLGDEGTALHAMSSSGASTALPSSMASSACSSAMGAGKVQQPPAGPSMPRRNR
jgi:hypothetical protein